MKLKGQVWKFKDNINTDEIIPARYLNTFDEKELASHCLEGANKDFPKKVKKGDIIVAGRNFGCGSSREHAPICLKGAGVSCVIAETFARIFYRNAINIGLPILESAAASRDIAEGDNIEVDLEKGKIRNVATNKIYSATAFPPFMRELIKAGGLMEYVKKKIF
ncbi:MAG: 3-isopropylmalate dehydratase small subunit [Elusimicrobia bacterium]|nr:3-isopropylmalate dehydratase small subunit [Elusimicrobiota bacterium]